MLGAAELGELGLERAHFRAEDELAMAEHPRDRGIDGAAEPAALRGNVDERDLIGGLSGGAACSPATTLQLAGTAAEAPDRDLEAGDSLLAGHRRRRP